MIADTYISIIRDLALQDVRNVSLGNIDQCVKSRHVINDDSLSNIIVLNLECKHLSSNVPDNTAMSLFSGKIFGTDSESEYGGLKNEWYLCTATRDA